VFKSKQTTLDMRMCTRPPPEATRCCTILLLTCSDYLVYIEG